MKNLLLGLMLLVGCTHVDAGHVGVKVDSCAGGGVEKEPVGVGYHNTFGPCTTIVEYPTYQQTLVLARNPKEGDHGNDADQSITVTSSEGLPINMDVSLSFTIEPKKVPHIYEKFRRDLDWIMSSFFRQAVRESLQETCAKYTAQQLYSDKREVSRAEVQTLLAAKLAADGFLVTQFTVNETRVPQPVEQAITTKVAMVQEAQRADQAVKKTEAEGRQKVAAATAEALAIKARADAEAYANKVIADSISPTLVEYERVKKWDGKMPQFTGGATPLVSLDK